MDFLPANCVVGQGQIDGRPAVVQGDDFTVRGGAADAAIWEKMVHAERLAHELRMPLVRLVDGTGGGGSVKSLETMGHTYVPSHPGLGAGGRQPLAVPVVAAALGPVAGLGAARVVASHFSVIVRRRAQLFVAGPARGGRGDGRDARQGGAGRRPHADARRRGGQRGRRRGRRARPDQALPLLPARRACGRRRRSRPRPTRPPGARRSSCRSSRATGASPTSARASSSWCSTAARCFEVGPRYGRSLITALARLDGRPVGVLASDPNALRRRPHRRRLREARPASSTSATSSACRWSTSSTSPAS